MMFSGELRFTGDSFTPGLKAFIGKNLKGF